MLTLLAAWIWIISGLDNQRAGQEQELGGGPIVETREFAIDKINQVEVALEEFKRVPKLKEDADPKPPLSWSHSAVAIDAESGQILFSKDERKKMPLASLTKIMTAIVLMEEIKDWKEPVKISQKAAFSGGANIHLKWDEEVRADDLFKAMLMNSDNAASIALAEHVSGNIEEFTKLMNDKAREIGALDTHFEEPSGLEDEKSFSNAYDMAKMTQYALKNDKIRTIMRTPGPLEISSCDGTIKHRVGNTNIYLKDEAKAPRVIGAKTGFTYNAGYCLMAAMHDKSGEREVIGVLLNSGQEMRWEEMEQMINWSLDNYIWN
ncbi:MAG: D-alanyl-D-alanine carboxypeptidase family protein [Patescibacteria group bacterium]|nr:D-alanyl-D-alanine carboxypeptidase [Patescibacteria group bacterium]